MMTTFDAHGANNPESLGPRSLPRIVHWVGAALREAREVASLLELIADSRIATPGTVRRRAAAFENLA